MQKYSVNQQLIETILSWVKSKEIAIPEIQRPFVWDPSKVRDLLDSLYKGYPVGYIIAWRNPSVRLKDGSTSSGKKILIDGQQRVIALSAAILGNDVINKEYRKIKIQIAFNPLEEKFEVFNPAIDKDVSWIPNIAEVIEDESLLKRVRDYCQKNPQADETTIESVLIKLKNIKKLQIGYVELTEDLDIETVTDIFVRINGEGVPLSQADFAMSKIAAHSQTGAELRKCIDYFCHLSIRPEFYGQISSVDIDFTKTPYFDQIKWLKNENDNLYDPRYNDVLRVAFTYKFKRGKLQDLVSLVSGRNFETRTYEEEIAIETMSRLQEAVSELINETNFKRFLMIVKSAGFVDSNLISSQNSLNFAYAVYLSLIEQKMEPAKIEKSIRRWLVMSILTGRYSGSPESNFDYDIKNIDKIGIEKYLTDIESAELSDSFWSVRLVQELNKSVITNPNLSVFFAAQCKDGDLGFLSSDITVRDMIIHRGDIHHIFPKAYLKKKYSSRGDYNQIANYVYAQQEINIRVGDKSPNIYFKEIVEQCNGGSLKYGGIQSMEILRKNMEQNCIPESIFDMDIEKYPQFLEERRSLMAKKMEKYYKSL